MRTLEQVTGALRRDGIDPDGHGERLGESREEHVKRVLDTAEICAIVEYDKAVNWPRIEAEALAEVLGAIPVQDGVNEHVEV